MKKKYVTGALMLAGVLLVAGCQSNIDTETVENTELVESISEDEVQSVSEQSISEDSVSEDEISLSENEVEEKSFELTVEEIEEMDLSGKSAEEVLVLYTKCDTEEITYINLSKNKISDEKSYKYLLSRFPNLKKIDECTFTYTLEEVEAMDKKGMTADEVVNLYLQSEKDAVTFINLNNRHVDDLTKLKANLLMFPNLEQVDMCDCGFTNEEMDAINKSLTNIKVVWMIHIDKWKFRTDATAFSTFQGHNITYKMTSKDAEAFKYCTDMVALDLGHNHVTDVSFLQYMPDLKILILVDNSPLSDISWLKYCPKLEYLEFFVDRVSDLSVFEYLPELKDVNIGYNPISDITYLKNLPNLERLWLESTRISREDIEILREIYPDAKIVVAGSGSVDQGWRTHKRYWAMRYMFKNNAMDPLFMDPDQLKEYEEEQKKIRAQEAIDKAFAELEAREAEKKALEEAEAAGEVVEEIIEE